MPPPNAARSTSSSPISKKSKRKSWFSLHRRVKHRAAPGETTSPLAPPSAFNYDSTTQPDTRLGPLQFAPNRLQSLHITPSERNLYLAAMSQLDQGPQPLPLWAEPPPILPRLPVSSPMDTAPPDVIPLNLHPLTAVPLSPKLVISPGLPGSGLMIREEFRRPQSPNKATRHALLCLLPTSLLRFTGFAPKTIIAIDRTMSENWPQGIRLRSEEMDKMSKRHDSGENLTWRVELHGRAWKVKGSQELESIRLLLAMLTTLAMHGWALVGSVQAAGMKKTCHNLLFRYDPNVEARPPAFFAVSMPLADRLSVISPPNKTTPAILNAVRSAITSNSHLTGSGQISSDPPNASTPDASKRLTWGKEGQAKGIKLEGWVHPGVFRFWIGGMRRWLGGTVKHGKVNNLHPTLLVSIMNHLSSINFELAGSIPLLPLAKGRDVLFFYSLPASGLTYLDSYRPDATTAPSSGSESMVLVSRTNTLPPVESAGHSRIPTSTSSGEQENQRAVPWTSILSEDFPTSPHRVKKASDGSSNSAPPPSSMPSSFVRQRISSEDSNKPLLPPNVAASPRQKNVLLKKNSLRQRSASATGSIDLPPPEAAASTTLPGAGVAATTSYAPESDQWSLIDVPAHVGRLGVTQYDITSAFPSVPNAETTALPPQSLPEFHPRPSMDTSSDESVYEDTNDIIHHTALPELTIPQESPQLRPGPSARAQEAFHPPAMALGNLVNQGADESPRETVPLRDPAASRRAGSAMVDVGSGIGVPSMHGSIGFFPTGQSIISDGGHSEVGGLPPVPPPKAGSSRTKISVGRYS